MTNKTVFINTTCTSDSPLQNLSNIELYYKCDQDPNGMCNDCTQTNCQEITTTSTATMPTTKGEESKPTVCCPCTTIETTPPTTLEVTTTSDTPDCNCSCDAALGSVTGLLIGLLVAVLTGWICTCVLMRRRETIKQKPQRLATV